MDENPPDTSGDILLLDDLTRAIEANADDKGLRTLREKVKGVELVTKTLTGLEELRRNGSMTVTLEVPREFAESLKSGRVFRDRGVLRDPGGGIVKHLDDVKPGKLRSAAKLVNIAFVAYDLVESHMVDEKLNEILDHVKEIDLKLDAQIRGKWRGALTRLQDAKNSTGANRTHTLQHALDMLVESEEAHMHLYLEKKRELAQQRSKYHKALYTITNKRALDRVARSLTSMANLRETLVIIKGATVEAYRLLNETENMLLHSDRLTEFLVSEVVDFKRQFHGAALEAIGRDFVDRIGSQLGKTQVLEKFHEENERIDYLIQTDVIRSVTLPTRQDNRRFFEKLWSRR